MGWGKGVEDQGDYMGGAGNQGKMCERFGWEISDDVTLKKTRIFFIFWVYFLCVLRLGICFLCVFIFWNLGSNSWYFQRDVMTIEWIFWHPMVPQKPEGHRSKVPMLFVMDKKLSGGEGLHNYDPSHVNVASGCKWQSVSKHQVQEIWTDVNSWWFHYIPRIGFIKNPNFHSHSVISLYYPTFWFNTIPTNRVKSRTSLLTRVTKHHCRPSLAAVRKSCQAKLA